MPRRPPQGSHPGMPSPEGRPSPEQSSGELPWTLSEERMLHELADTVASLRDGAKAGTLTKEEQERFATAVFALKKAIEEKKDALQHPPEVGELLQFTYDTAKARERGFSEMTVEAYPKAQAIAEAIYNHDPRFVTVHKKGQPDPDDNTKILTKDKIVLDKAALKAAWHQDCSDLNNPDGESLPEKSEWYFQALAEHRLSNTIDGDDSNNLTNPTKPHTPRFGRRAFLLAMDFEEFDYDDAEAKKQALDQSPGTKKILKTLFATEDPTNIRRDEVNIALWSDHENRVQSDTAKNIIRELLESSENPDDFELRLMRPDEYQRAAASKGYGQNNLWTHMDGYYAHDDGLRFGLSGGGRDGGGAADVGNDLRGYRRQGITVRLVLSRKG